jgi:hypothetical protein
MSGLAPGKAKPHASVHLPGERTSQIKKNPCKSGRVQIRPAEGRKRLLRFIPCVLAALQPFGTSSRKTT